MDCPADNTPDKHLQFASWGDCEAVGSYCGTIQSYCEPLYEDWSNCDTGGIYCEAIGSFCEGSWSHCEAIQSYCETIGSYSVVIGIFFETSGRATNGRL